MKKPPALLLVEDDQIEHLMIARAFQRLPAPIPLVWAKDGVEALRIMRGDADRDALARPYVVLLDLNLPQLSGLELLAELRADPALADTVVFVQTTSLDEADQAAAYALSVAGYLPKSPDPAAAARIVEMLAAYLAVSELPAPRR